MCTKAAGKNVGDIETRYASQEESEQRIDASAESDSPVFI